MLLGLSRQLLEKQLNLGVSAAVSLVTVHMVEATKVQPLPLGELETAGDVRGEDMGSGLRLYDCLKLAGFC